MTITSAYYTTISMLDVYNEIEYVNFPISLDDNRVRRLFRQMTPTGATVPGQISLASAYATTWGYHLEVIVVGGGGGGGAGRRDRSGGAGAGGGGGGISYGNFLVKRGGFSAYALVGAGGSAVAAEAYPGNPGGTSQLEMVSTAGRISITSSGGVGGQGGENGQRQGGSGGAGSTVSGNGVSPSPSLYYPPGVLPIAGGNGGNGLDDIPHGSYNAGGNGFLWAVDNVYYGGGGGGGGDGGSPPPNGGLGGGGSGQSSAQGTPGTNGFGGGGGGGASWGNNTYNYGGNGGNGVVKIRYYNTDGVLLNIPGATGVDNGFWITHTCLSPAPITWIGPQ